MWREAINKEELDEFQLEIKKEFLKADEHVHTQSTILQDAEDISQIFKIFEEHKPNISNDSMDSEEHKLIINKDFKDSEEHKLIINKDFEDSE
ncbi:532_t:CDS:2, partial [Dentiscutata erythropus]